MKFSEAYTYWSIALAVPVMSRSKALPKGFLTEFIQSHSVYGSAQSLPPLTVLPIPGYYLLNKLKGFGIANEVSHPISPAREATVFPSHIYGVPGSFGYPGFGRAADRASGIGDFEFMRRVSSEKALIGLSG